METARQVKLRDYAEAGKQNTGNRSCTLPTKLNDAESFHDKAVHFESPVGGLPKTFGEDTIQNRSGVEPKLDLSASVRLVNDKKQRDADETLKSLSEIQVDASHEHELQDRADSPLSRTSQRQPWSSSAIATPAERHESASKKTPGRTLSETMRFLSAARDEEHHIQRSIRDLTPQLTAQREQLERTETVILQRRKDLGQTKQRHLNLADEANRLLSDLEVARAHHSQLQDLEQRVESERQGRLSAELLVQEFKEREKASDCQIKDMKRRWKIERQRRLHAEAEVERLKGDLKAIDSNLSNSERYQGDGRSLFSTAESDARILRHQQAHPGNTPQPSRIESSRHGIVYTENRRLKTTVRRLQSQIFSQDSVL